MGENDLSGTRAGDKTIEGFQSDPREVDSLTGAVNEGPLVALVFGADARLQDHVPGRDLLALLQRSLHRPSVGPLCAQSLPRAAGVTAPATLGLLQALGTRPQARTVLG